MRVCKVISRRTGEPCGAHVVTGKEVCWQHGGASLGGIESPRFKHGRYSKFMPKGLIDRYERALADPELTSLRDEIATVEARIAERMSAIETEGGASADRAEAKRRLAKRIVEVKKAQPIDYVEYVRCADMLTELELAEPDTRAIWEEVDRLTEIRRKLSESETKRLATAQQSLSVEAVLALATALGTEVYQNILNCNACGASLKEQRRRVASGIQKLLLASPAAVATEIDAGAIDVEPEPPGAA